MRHEEYCDSLVDKTNLKQNTSLLSIKVRFSKMSKLDFAENYSIIVQDAIKGYPWDNSQCLLHPLQYIN